MKINKTNIKSTLGITSTDYDSQIDILIPQILDSICQYCKNDFILYGNNGHVYESIPLVIASTTITLTTVLPIAIGDHIRIYGTNYNDGLYQVKTYTGGVITIEATKELRAESITGIVALIDFPSMFLNIISEYTKNNIMRDGSVKSESIDDTKIDYFVPFNSENFINQNSGILNKFRNVFKREFYDVFKTGVCE